MFFIQIFSAAGGTNQLCLSTELQTNKPDLIVLLMLYCWA